ncbi:hypothetical protein T05_1300 [Trichinella murrelli]|uniref:Uncharacterized protein n=1 Tax=Trichinella murrelli TaxID=144512 RepID=A0A0V0TK26_9BILA|nr:hypothetical protein T05_1300 [Trichinella murrelli]
MVTGGRCVRFGLDDTGVCAAAEAEINAGEPGVLRNTVEEYPPVNVARGAYEDELRKWIKDGWLVPYDESEHGPPKGLLLLMAVIQRNKKKPEAARVAQTGRQCGPDRPEKGLPADPHRQIPVAIPDGGLQRQAILPDPSGIRPKCRAISHESRDELRALPGSGCQERNLSVHRRHPGERKRRRRGPREGHLAHYGLTCKTHERAADGARLLGLKVWGERGKLMWRRDNDVGGVPDVLTRRSVFSYCGKLVSHFPDEVIDGDKLRGLIQETALAVKKRDPARGEMGRFGGGSQNLGRLQLAGNQRSAGSRRLDRGRRGVAAPG